TISNRTAPVRSRANPEQCRSSCGFPIPSVSSSASPIPRPGPDEPEGATAWKCPPPRSPSPLSFPTTGRREDDLAADPRGCAPAARGAPGAQCSSRPANRPFPGEAERGEGAKRYNPREARVGREIASWFQCTGG